MNKVGIKKTTKAPIFLFFWLVGLVSLSLHAQIHMTKGFVFEDRNGNGMKDPGEIGISNVTVSDQQNTANTDSSGAFYLEGSDDFPYVFISMPTGYQGQYYYTKASEMLFPVQKTKIPRRFKFIHASDTHIDSLNLPRMERFRQLSDSIGPAFIIITGDLIRDALRVNETIASNYFRMYTEEINKFNVPVYSCVGNHELFGIERDKSLVSSDHPLYGKKMYRKFLGPDYYSFNYGGLHFISIDALDFQNLYYFGGVDSLQLKWLENDLRSIPKETPIITFNHIPFVSPGFSFQDFESDPFYGPQLLMQNHVLHHRHLVYNFKQVQNRIGDRPYPLALAGHYHAAQEGIVLGTKTKFAQTSAITRPNVFDYNGFKVHSGFTVYEVEDRKIISSTFVPLNIE
ncbi:MAG: metallophosphoesterase [Maribacter sp.]|nr:metallophosphoesterase [Maribacter sp.]